MSLVFQHHRPQKSESAEKLKNWQTHANQGLRSVVSFSTRTKEAMMLLAATQLHT
jgi:hypothetical protein